MELKFRNLRADEIDVRIGSVNKGGAALLLYKDARADMNILDETVGPLNWQRKHEIIDGKLFCTVSIFDSDKKEWISKQDVGTESYTEKEHLIAECNTAFIDINQLLAACRLNSLDQLTYRHYNYIIKYWDKYVAKLGNYF